MSGRRSIQKLIASTLNRIDIKSTVLLFCATSNGGSSWYTMQTMRAAILWQVVAANGIDSEFLPGDEKRRVKRIC